ncbi:hypothetical protein ACFONN_13320 [Dyella humi]|uniref:Uncharacterized protein n=1 Tax=Dyella humi TaxID=1770547 RepID=A0ABW8ILF2_9GAMM
MKSLKGKVFLWIASLAFLGCALPAAAQQQNSVGSPDITPQYQLTSCDLVPPDGYVWVALANRASCGSVGHPMIAYVFESYFDKPVGTTLALCSPNFVPAGWYIINEISNFNCSSNSVPTKQWVITRSQ